MTYDVDQDNDDKTFLAGLSLINPYPKKWYFQHQEYLDPSKAILLIFVVTHMSCGPSLT